MTKPYIFLTCFVPRPHNPKVKIDVYLESLIDDFDAYVFITSKANNI